jgi:hypothetical protein
MDGVCEGAERLSPASTSAFPQFAPVFAERLARFAAKGHRSGVQRATQGQTLSRDDLCGRGGVCGLCGSSLQAPASRSCLGEHRGDCCGSATGPVRCLDVRSQV